MALEGMSRLRLDLTPSHLLHRFLHFLTLGICLAAAFYQVGILMNLFFKYPVTISISTERQSLLSFPGITLCTTAGIPLSVFTEEMKGSFEEFVSVRKTELNYSQVEGLPLPQQQDIINEMYATYITLADLPSLVRKAVNFTDFVPMARCANRDDEKQDCLKELEHTSLETIQGDFMCWTMFHESRDWMSTLFESAAPAGYKQSAFLLADKGLSFNLLNRTIQPQEVVRLLVNLTATQSVQLGQPAYGVISVHDYDEIRLNRRKAVILEPGNRYEVYYEERVYETLPAPYKSHCFPYVMEHLDDYSGGDPCVHQFFDAPLSRSDCFYGCMAQKGMMAGGCNCYPPDIPYLRKNESCHYDYEHVRDSPVEGGAGGGEEEDSSGGGNADEKVCNWVRRISPQGLTPEEILRKARDKFEECFGRHEDSCLSLCPVDCSVVKVATEVQSSIWPSNEEIWQADIDEREKLTNFRKCCAVVSMKQLSQERLVFSESPKYEPVEFISYVGGVVSLWVGFTFVGIFDYIRHSARFLFQVFTGSSHEKGKTGTTDRPTGDVTAKAALINRRKKYSERLMESLKKRTNHRMTDRHESSPYDWPSNRGLKANMRQKWVVDKRYPFPVYDCPYYR